ncbi:MAG: response regulator transcription factor [Deltaproteobacteria bacterium]|nr:response regulator transcription factor [Deltaproteobacteria bacterium]
MYTILLIDSSTDTRANVLAALGEEFTIMHVTEPAHALQKLKERRYDLVLMECDLPGTDGFRLFAHLKNSSTPNLSTPVVFLTARNTSMDKATAFTMGAEDYVLKPFDPIELRARVAARIRKTKQPQFERDTVYVEKLTFHLSRHKAFVTERGARRDLKLTPIEFRILHYLAQHPGMAFNREQILAAVSSDPTDVYDRSVDSHVSNIRKKLGPHAGYIESVRGVGYAFSSNQPITEEKAAA